MRKIVITARPSDYHASVDGDNRKWGCGRTVAEAIGNCVLNHASVLGVEISEQDTIDNYVSCISATRRNSVGFPRSLFVKAYTEDLKPIMTPNKGEALTFPTLSSAQSLLDSLLCNPNDFNLFVRPVSLQGYKSLFRRAGNLPMDIY